MEVILFLTDNYEIYLMLREKKSLVFPAMQPNNIYLQIHVFLFLAAS